MQKTGQNRYDRRELGKLGLGPSAGDRGRAHASCQRERRRRRPHWLPHCTHRARLASNEVESGIQDGRERNGGNQSGDAAGYVIGIPSNCGRTDHLPRGLVNGEDRGRAYTSEPVWCVGKGHGHRHFQCDQRDPGALLKRHRLVAYGLRLSAISASPVITAAAEPLRQLGYGQVQLAAGPLQRQARENHLLVLALDEKALLRPYRIRAGLAAPGHDLGGWYGTHAFAPGANFGQWLSALSRFYAITGDVPTQDKVHRLVCAYAATLESEGRFYQNNRFPAYTFDKLVGGLVDARMLAHDAAALSVLERTTQIAVAYLPAHAMARNAHSKPGEDFSKHAWDESYTLPENQFFAWHLTGDDRHCVLARRFLYDEFFSPLANGDNVLPGKQADSHVNALSSAAQAYLSLGSPMYLQAARHGFAMIDAQSYATGGWGPDEHFIVPGSGAHDEFHGHLRGCGELPCKCSVYPNCNNLALSPPTSKQSPGRNVSH